MIMKKIVSLILVSVMCIFALSACANDGETPNGFKNASNEACDFDFYVPETWTVSQSSGTVAAYCSPSDPSSISVMPAELEHADSTVSDWWDGHKADFETVYDSFTMIGEKNVTMGGIKGKTYTFTAKLLGKSDKAEGTDTPAATESGTKTVTYYFSITAVVRHSRLYMMTFTSTEDLYENHTDTLAKVIEHFKFH